MYLPVRVFLIIFFFSPILIAAENWQQDELRHMLREMDEEGLTAPDSTLSRLDIYIEYARKRGWKEIETFAMSQKAGVYNVLGKMDKVKVIVDEYLPVAERLKDSKSILNLYSVQLAAYDAKVEQKMAEKVRTRYETEALASGSQRDIAGMYADIGHSMQLYGDIRQSLGYLQKALKIFEEINDQKGLGSTLNVIAILYDELKDYQQAIAYYKRALAVYQNKSDTFTLSVLYYNLGQTYYQLNDVGLAKKMIKQALEMSRALQDEVGEAYAHRYLGKIEFDQKSYTAAHEHFDIALAVFKRFKSVRMQFLTSLSLAEVLAASGELDQALVKLIDLEVTVQEFNRSGYVVDYYTLLYKLEKQNKNYAASLAALEKVEIEKSTINKKEKERSLQELMIKFDSKQKDAENKLLQQQNELKQLKLTDQEAQKTIFILAFSFVIFAGCIISVLLFKQIQHRKRFKTMAMRDELTGAPNRRAIMALANNKFKTCQEEGAKLSVAMLDIDYFKMFNDTYGHEVGDKVLQIFSDACEMSLRSQDRYGRFGGEEWLLVLVDAEVSHIEVIFNRLRARIQHIDVEDGPQNISITFSLGAAEITPSDMNIEATIKRADDNLYKAKEDSRDCFVISI